MTTRFQDPTPRRDVDDSAAARTAPTQAALLERGQQLQQAREQSLVRVDALVRTQRDLGQGLQSELATLRDQGEQLDTLQRQQDAVGLAALVRFFDRRRTTLRRRSVAEGLLRHYEAVTVQLRQATAFADELRLCALELQDEVDGLHRELAGTVGQEKSAAGRLIELEDALDELAASTEPSDPERARMADRIGFAERTAAVDLQLLRARSALLREHLGPARQLRDTVMNLHEEMSVFVLNATQQVNAAGRRIQALGMAADAATVVGELSESMARLDEAMAVTEDYVEQTHDLITRVLPELNARVQARARTDAAMLGLDLEELDRARARALADQALQEAAHAEVESLERSL